MGVSRQDYWSGLPLPSPEHLSDLGIELVSPMSPALQADSLPTGSLFITLWYLFCFLECTQFTYPFCGGWILGLFPVLGYYEQCCCELLFTSLLVNAFLMGIHLGAELLVINNVYMFSREFVLIYSPH